MVSLNLERGGADIQETDPQISFQDWKFAEESDPLARRASKVGI